MKPTLLFLSCALVLTGCDPKSANPADAPTAADQAARVGDIPLLPVKPGDAWIYQVRLEIPQGVTSAGAAEVSTKHQRTRTYLGKVAAAEGLPETDCFEVAVPGSPREREFVDIHDDRILMRGSLIMRPETKRPMWLDQPAPFVIAGMKPGTSMPELKAAGGSLTRQTRVIAREDVNVPAGSYPCIRLLTTGNDGELELRRTIWFSPGSGIIREEKTRYRRDQLIFRETHELTALKRAP
jgi:hypothetical protein